MNDVVRQLVVVCEAQQQMIGSLTTSIQLLTQSVAQLLGEEMGQPVQDEQKAEPLPDNLDAD